MIDRCYFALKNMATVFRRSQAVLIRIFDKIRRNRCDHVALRSIGTRSRCENNRKRIRISLGVLTGAATTCGSILYFLDSSVKATALQATPPSYPWKLDGFLSSLDHTAVRRGWQVYKAVCSACHGIQYVRFMDLIDVSHTKEEAVAIAAEYEVRVYHRSLTNDIYRDRNECFPFILYFNLYCYFFESFK